MCLASWHRLGKLLEYCELLYVLSLLGNLGQSYNIESAALLDRIIITATNIAVQVFTYKLVLVQYFTTKHNIHLFNMSYLCKWNLAYLCSGKSTFNVLRLEIIAFLTKSKPT